MDLHATARFDAALVVELHRRCRCGFRRSASEARHARPRARASRGSRQRRCEPQDLGRVEGRVGLSFPAPCSAGGPVLQDDALGLELVADAVGGREVAVLLGCGALGDARSRSRSASAPALEPVVGRALPSSPRAAPHWPSAWPPSSADRRDSASGVLRSSRKRVEHAVVDLARARHRQPRDRGRSSMAFACATRASVQGSGWR